MNLFHSHRWTEIQRVSAKRYDAREIQRLAESMSESMAQQLLFGVTTIVLKCSICGDVKTVEFLGVA